MYTAPRVGQGRTALLPVVSCVTIRVFSGRNRLLRKSEGLAMRGGAAARQHWAALDPDGDNGEGPQALSYLA